MKKFLVISFVIVIVLSLSFPSHAIGNMAGYDWVELSEEAKEAYLAGLYDGFTFLSLVFFAGFDPDHDLEEMAENLEQEGEIDTLEEEDYPEVIEAIDKEFAERDDLSTTIFDLLAEETLEEVDEDLNLE